MAKLLPSYGIGEGLLGTTLRSDSVVALGETISGLTDLDTNGLCLQWRNHLGGSPPAHLPRWLLLRILAYRIQAIALGGLNKEMLRVLRQPKGRALESSDARPFETRRPTTQDGISLRAGALLVREWNGKLQRVMVLEDGFAWNGETYGSLSQIAKAMTGTSWNGHRFLAYERQSPIRARCLVAREGFAAALRSTNTAKFVARVPLPAPEPQMVSRGSPVRQSAGRAARRPRREIREAQSDSALRRLHPRFDRTWPAAGVQLPRQSERSLGGLC